MDKITSAVAGRYYLGELAWGRQISYMLAFNALLIVSSYIQIPLPFSPVPITAQTMAVLACGLFLGPVRGSITVAAYLAEGAIGVPVFAGGAAGLGRILGPTGGYLIGFLPAAFVVGVLSEKVRNMNYLKLTGVLTIGTALIFIPGLMVLSLYPLSTSLLAAGLFPFIPGAIIKIVVTASALSGYRKIRQSL